MVTYRTSGPWGSGKGSNLVEAEVDQNFYEHEQRIGEVETNPPQPVSIDHFVIEGNLMTIVLTNGVEHGPFVLPIGQWRFAGPWQPITQYFVGDLFTNGGALYFTRVQHISEDATFDPGLFGPEGNIYELVLPAPVTPYDIAMFYRDRVINGGAVVALHLLARDVSLAADFAGSVASLTVAPTTSNITLPIFHNDTQIGAIAFAIGAVRGVFSGAPPSPPPEPFALLRDDTIDVRLPPEVDDTAAGLAVTITGWTPSAPPPSPPSP